MLNIQVVFNNVTNFELNPESLALDSDKIIKQLTFEEGMPIKNYMPK